MLVIYQESFSPVGIQTMIPQMPSPYNQVTIPPMLYWLGNDRGMGMGNYI